MKIFCLTLLIVINWGFGYSQKSESFKIDSLQKQFKLVKADSLKASIILEIIFNTGGDNLGNLNNGYFAKVYDAYRSRLDIYENPENQQLFERVGKKSGLYEGFWESFNNDIFNYGLLMGVTANTEEQLHYYKKAYQMAKDRNDLWQQNAAQINIAFAFQQKNRLDSAQFYVDQIFANTFDPLGRYFFYLFYLAGEIRLEAGHYEQAKALFLKGIDNALKNNFDLEIGVSINSLGLSRVYQRLNRSDSSYYYGIKSLNLVKKIKEVQVVKVDLAYAYENMFDHFQRFAQPDSAFKYLVIAHKERAAFTKKTISNLAAFQQVLLSRQLALKDLQRDKIEMQGRMRMYILLTTLIVFVAFGVVLLYNYLQKKKANVLLASKNEEIESTLLRLKSTQSQLIQSEKMASLGELTAGIAHEIQNPLNFVNNFSEVNQDLLQEMNEEIAKGNFDEAKAIAKDVIDNEEKINHHGKRADAIVKSMLQHSRSNAGQKEPTDINALCDEYLRLAYHGLKAKDKSFNAKFEAHLDPALPRVNVVPQDIGRVILNLINNAFYAVNERSKKGEAGYQPTVSLTTKLMANSQLQIAIKDNGPGIPDALKDKIFQPFFTTKPTGQGTGLGLSLSYDIVKAHGGELKVETQENIGTEFYIILPL